MNSFIAATIVVLASSTSAFAADLVEQPVGSPAFVWSGPYVGIDAGAGWLNGDFGFGGAGTFSEDFNGGLFGGFTGYNWQFDSIVLGVEGNLDYNTNDKGFVGANIGTDWAGAVRARVGYAVDHALFYGAAGWSATRGFIEVPGFADESKTFNGYTVGAGVDYAFTNNVFVRGEYRYNDYGSKEILGVDVDLDQNVVKLGIGVKF